MRTYLLPENGNLYKMNLHTHSTLSDGQLTPEELKKYYKAQGYSAVAFTDHRVCMPHPELTDAQFIALTGIELDFGAKDETGAWAHTTHFCGVSRDPLAKLDYPKEPLPLSYANVNAEIAKLNAAGFITTVNHPVWSDMSTEDVLCLHGMHGIEVFNSCLLYTSGVTEAGTEYMGIMKSAAGIGTLLLEGIGDTIRVSLTAPPEREAEAGVALLRAIGVRNDGVKIVSCPSCGRCCIDLISIASEVEKRLADCKKNITVAVMGCAVNGPGEASQADFGIAGGKGEGILFKKGQILRKVPMDRLADALLDLIDEE